MAENRGGRKDKNNAENGIKMIEKRWNRRLLVWVRAYTERQVWEIMAS